MRLQNGCFTLMYCGAMLIPKFKSDLYNCSLAEVLKRHLMSLDTQFPLSFTKTCALEVFGCCVHFFLHS